MADTKRDYYEVLGVSRDATAQDIKKSYRRLARTHHPDANPGDSGAEERFKELTEAYEVLSNTDSRQAYDTYGHQVPRGGNGGYPGGNPYGGNGMQDIFEAFFGDSMGGGSFFGGGGRGPARGRDAEADVVLELVDAAFGVERTVNVQIVKTCGRCSGSGGEKTHVCETCGGAGRVRSVRNTMLGQMVTEGECPTCRGRGRAIDVACEQCRGSGTVSEMVERTFRVPAGIEDGMRLRVSGGGHDGEAGAPPGDLYINIRVKEDEALVRDGDDLIHRTSVSFVQAALGTEIGVPTLEGDGTTMKVPAGTQPGATMRLPGKGMPKLRGVGRGNIKVLVDVMVPTHVTAEQRELLEQFEALSGDETYSSGSSFFDRLRGVFR